MTMGFFDGLRRMMQGKPVFVDPANPMQAPITADQAVTTKQTAPLAPPPVREPQMPPKQEKVIPTFDLRHCRTSVNGDMAQVTIWATNTSTVDIEIDKCVMIDTTTEIDRQLSPGRSHEIVIYRGRTPQTDHAHKANIFYKAIRENEYYRVDFSVEYNRESNGMFTVEDLHPEHYAVKELS